MNVRFLRVGMLLLIFLIHYLSADIDNLQYLGHNEVNPYHLMDVEIVGNNAYVANGLGTGMEVYDISNPLNPQRTFTYGPAAWRTVSYGDTLLASFCRRDGVVLFDISGTTPVVLGQYNPSGNLEALEGGDIINDVLYCAVHQNGIYFIDISDPSNPMKVGEFSSGNLAAWNVAGQDSFLFVANGRFGLLILGVSGGVHQVAQLSLPGLTNDINLDGTTAVLSLGVDGIATVDISNPYNPLLLDMEISEGCVWGSGIDNHRVISGSWRVMELFDITNPNTILKAGWDNTKTWAHGTDIRSDGVIAVADWHGVSCYEVGADAGADIDVYPQVIDFGPVSGSRDTNVIVYNTGSATLNVTSINSPAGITPNPSSFSVPPGDSQIVIVTATGSGNVYSTITYVSNDPDESSKIQEVYKNNSSFPQVGSSAPDFTLMGSDGQWYTLSQLQGKVVFLEFGGAW